MLESIHAEADALSDMDPSSVLQFALSRRIDALKEFVEQFVIVEWAEVSATNGCRRRRGE
ncbi:MAG TPA: hypothetical protein VFK05_12555 [Polyangiaceae bacterium]|nr:hypothetical protein [Polyangiaceae bacterium]